MIRITNQIKIQTMARTYNSGWRDWFNTQSADVGNAFVMEGFKELSAKLDALLVSNPDTERNVQIIISKAMKMVRANVSDAYKKEMDADPREAYRAVRSAVYRRILGGNVNILRNKRAGSPSSYQPTRTLKSGQRGGNRRLRTDRTMRMESYAGKDRGFILRFLEGGTSTRKMGNFTSDSHRSAVRRGSQGGDVKKYGNLSNVNTGNRGRISGRHIFASFAPKYMDNAIQFLEQEIDKLIADVFGTN